MAAEMDVAVALFVIQPFKESRNRSLKGIKYMPQTLAEFIAVAKGERSMNAAAAVFFTQIIPITAQLCVRCLGTQLSDHLIRTWLIT